MNNDQLKEYLIQEGIDVNQLSDEHLMGVRYALSQAIADIMRDVRGDE